MHLWLAVLMTVLAAIQGADECQVDFEKVGCFKDDLADRRLPHFLITDRDPEDTSRFGQLFDWSNFEGSVRSLLCRCSSKARSHGYRYIGIQFYAECWAGNSYHRAVSDGCSRNCTQGYHTSLEGVCNFDREADCVGMGYTNFIYKLLDCSQIVDIAILLDVSTSMRDNGGFAAAKNLIKTLIHLLHISRHGAHLSLVTFTRTAKVEFNFTSHYNKGEDTMALKSYIDNIQAVYGSTWPDSALDIANEVLFLEKSIGIPFVVTITDGHLHYDSVITPVLEKLKSKRVNLLSVGVGNDINKMEVGYLALSNQQNVFDGNNKNSAQNIAHRIKSLAEDECSAQDSKR
ncbi:uncharacterized protein LOC110249981 [Exaiptasia diaphana]|uniref:VWFA domain-containing protein n=1 Tax=Exaiptasia diaphana TaxID=2652724 RepID=A0A913YW22_EXADI|nr:uncharacterized protein LOC110249981 [Exaiptasia diaphana]KXJ23701.1 Collagen alpha-5(VI) chain [Exaiptasia diaphana]